MKKLIRVRFKDSRFYSGWSPSWDHPENPVEAVGVEVREDDEHVIIAQSWTEDLYGNILKIPKFAVVSITILGIVLLFIIFTEEKYAGIKDAILAMFR